MAPDGGDDGSTRYSPLDQINAQNVKNLKIAWTWRGDNFGSGPEIKNETTPLMVDGVLYFTAGDRRAVVAADPGTGETLWMWRLDEGARADGRAAKQPRRGLLDRRTAGQNPHRHAGLPAGIARREDRSAGCRFGEDGIVDMTKEVEKDANFNPAIGHLMNTSPPLIVRQRRRHPDVARKRPRSEVDEVPQGRHHGVRRANREEAVERSTPFRAGASSATTPG